MVMEGSSDYQRVGAETGSEQGTRTPHLFPPILCFFLIALARPRGKPAPMGAFCRAQPSRTQSGREEDGEWVGVEVQKE